MTLQVFFARFAFTAMFNRRIIGNCLVNYVYYREIAFASERGQMNINSVLSQLGLPFRSWDLLLQ